LRLGSGVMTLRGRVVTPSTGGAVLSSDDCGSSVERTAELHPLWRWEVRLVCAAWWGALDGVQLWFQLVVRLRVL
jgi:hypothetical protein